MARFFTRPALGIAVALGTSALLGAPAQALMFKTILGPEVGGATGSGNATLLIDEVTNDMYIDVNFQGLSGATTVAHIHGPTARSLSHISTGTVTLPPVSWG
jgi:CHRD domain